MRRAVTLSIILTLLLRAAAALPQQAPVSGT